MKKNRVKELWRQGKPAVQGWCSSGNPYIAELMAHAGFDAVVIDWQHGVGVSQDSVVACLQAMSGSDAVPLVRVPWNAPEYIWYALDAGAYGVIVPMVNSYAEAEAAGRACRYAPRGCRSVAGNRPSLSEPLPAYVQRANDEILCLVMIETVKALENVEEIARAPEIDGLYIGPSDLSLDMGLDLSNWADDPRHLAAVERVFAAARANGIAPCHHGGSPEVSAKFVKMGSMLCQVGNDMRLLAAATASALTAFRAALG
ncbi:MAG: 2,4-dihydroxyhept-2-ene-1,7-dioic acid aldolase [Candidatus Tectimicrobiota bacterium]|nr:MAG: 2,4-dihydroxyhept-2-ene-1,7-dioic acid aldolase [Candidatus Tectomicrobia bacterium]